MKTDGYNYTSPRQDTMSGALRMKNNRLEINDGSTWMRYHHGSVNIGLSPSTEKLLEWAKAKMEQEMEIAAIVAANPSLAEAAAELARANDEFETLVMLTKRYAP